MLFAAVHPGRQVDVDVDAILGHLRNTLSKYKQPVDITILDVLPNNAVGKIAKPVLRHRLASELASAGHSEGDI